MFYIFIPIGLSSSSLGKSPSSNDSWCIFILLRSSTKTVIFIEDIQNSIELKIGKLSIFLNYKKLKFLDSSLDFDELILNVYILLKFDKC